MGQYYSYEPGARDQSGELLGKGIAAAGEGIAAALQRYSQQRDETDRMRSMLEGIPDISPEILQKFESGSRGAKAGVFASAIADYQRRQEEEARKQQEALQMRMAAMRAAGSRKEPPEMRAPEIMHSSDGAPWYMNPKTGAPMRPVPQPEVQVPPSIKATPVLGPDGQPTGMQVFMDQTGNPIPPQYIQQPEMDMTDPSARPPGMSLGEAEALRRKQAGIKARRPPAMPEGEPELVYTPDGRPYDAHALTGKFIQFRPGYKPATATPVDPAGPTVPLAPTPAPSAPGVTGRINSLSSLLQ